MARLHDLVFDCRHPASLARFWAAALDGYEVAPYDDEEIERLRRMGINDIEDDPSVLVIPSDGVGPRIFFALVPEPKTVKNRVHLDVKGNDLAELVRLGARVVAEYEDHYQLADPEGNEFCLLPADA